MSPGHYGTVPVVRFALATVHGKNSATKFSGTGFRGAVSKGCVFGKVVAGLDEVESFQAHRQAVKESSNFTYTSVHVSSSWADKDKKITSVDM